MNKPVLGLLLGGVLGVFDGLSALLSAPEVAPDIMGIVIGSTFKGVLAGALTGWVATKYNSMTVGLIAGLAIGAVFAAMNTMYAAVGARTREIGTLRVLGYRRRSVVVALLVEGAFLAFIGGVLGCALAFHWNGYTTATMGFETFSEIVFEFRVTPWLVARGLIFAVVVGLIGTALPAIRAARLPVIAALKSL